MSEFLSKIAKGTLLEINPALVKPKSARLIITLNCQFKCQMCTFWSDPYWNGKKVDPSLDTVKYWIKEMADFGVKEIDIGGGEPFVRGDLMEIVKEIKAKGMTCALTTNGWAVTEENFPRELDCCEISIDGARPETNDKIRGTKGAWERAVNAVKIAKKHCPTHINFVIQADNYLEMVDYCKFAKSLGVLASFIPLSLKLAAQPNLSPELGKYNIPVLKRQMKEALKTGVVMNSPGVFTDFIKNLEHGRIHPQKCFAPSRVILVFADSDVYPCGNFDVPVGKLVPPNTFKEIYKNYESMRKEVWSGKHKFCGSCTYGDVANRKTILKAAGPFLKRSLAKKEQIIK